MEGPKGCILKDDVPWLLDKFLDSDGYILGAPVWSLSPCGVVTDFRDRIFGPKMDVAGWELDGGAPQWLGGRTQHRPGALISVGGALTENWTSLGLATLYTTTFSAQINVIDHLNIHAVADPGEALTREDYVLRAKYLGRILPMRSIIRRLTGRKSSSDRPRKRRPAPAAITACSLPSPEEIMWNVPSAAVSGRLRWRTERFVTHGRRIMETA